jgi:polyhydroxyalkanoate synthesis regulator phasin
MLGKNGEAGFEAFRRERQRQRRKVASGPGTPYSSDALRELEAVEAREERDQQLTREVHDFFAAATRQAAGIVEKVSREAEAEVGQRLEREVESFLIDALARMNSFVLTVLQQRRGPVAEQRLEPSVQNLVGQPLDEFRWAGTAGLAERHIGQDPFATDPSAVRGELGGRETAVAAAVPPEVPGAAPVEPVPEAEVAVAAAAAPRGDAHGAGSAGSAQVAASLEQFKTMLRALVQQGTMTRDEARAAWQARLRSVGAVPVDA